MPENSEQLCGEESPDEPDRLEREAHALEAIFNEATADYSPALEWFAMRSDPETDQQYFAMNVEKYADGDGLDALRDYGREVSYIEAFVPYDGDDAVVQLELAVTGEVPEVGDR